MRKLDVTVHLNGDVFTAETRPHDYMAFDLESKKRGWGSLAEVPSTWEAFISWRALSRTRQISMPFEAFAEQADYINAEQAEVEALPKDQTADSSSS